MVDDLLAQRERGLELGSADPSLRLEALEVHLGEPPLVLPVGHHVVRGRAHDQVRRSELVRQRPPARVRPPNGGRKVCGIPLGRSPVDPRDDGSDLLVRERDVVREVLDPDRAVDVPGGHDAPLDAVTDALRPAKRLPVRQQGHGADPLGAMTRLTGRLEDRGHVGRERGCSVLGKDRTGGGGGPRAGDRHREERTLTKSRRPSRRGSAVLVRRPERGPAPSRHRPTSTSRNPLVQQQKNSKSGTEL